MKMHRFTLQAEVEPVRFEPGSNPTELFLLLAHLSQDHKTDSKRFVRLTNIYKEHIMYRDYARC